MKIKLYFAALMAGTLCLCTLPATAGQYPKGKSNESRIREVNYNPDQVVELETAYGYQTTVEFGNEQIKTVATGDTIGWQIHPLGNRLFVKPVEQPIAGVDSTNITVITDKRNYYFNATTSKRKKPAYVVRFNYAPKVALQKRSQAAIAARPKYRDYLVDKNGSNEINILDVYDDGQFTFFQFDPRKPLPAIYHVNGDDKEEIANVRREGNYQVFEGLGDRFTIRIGQQFKCVRKATASVPRTTASINDFSRKK